MLKFALRRIVVAIFVALTVSIIAFLLLRLSGDLASALAGEEATAEDIDIIRIQYGLDRPMVVQYLDWLFKAIQGDFGNSLYYEESVLSLVGSRLPVSITLGVCGLAFALTLSIPLRRGRREVYSWW